MPSHRLTFPGATGARLVALVAPLALAACAAIGPAAPNVAPAIAPTIVPTSAALEQRYPDILAVELMPAADGSFTVVVTVSSPYDTPARYADGWRVLAPDGNLIAEHTLLHDHAAEQPFTRQQSGVRIPDGVSSVTIQG